MKCWQLYILLSAIFSSQFASETTCIVMGGIYFIIGGIAFIVEDKK